MSKISNFWDNAVAESFFAILKKERVFNTNYKNQTEAGFDIADYISWYNHQRLHSPLNYESP